MTHTIKYEVLDVKGRGFWSFVKHPGSSYKPVEVTVKIENGEIIKFFAWTGNKVDHDADSLNYAIEDEIRDRYPKPISKMKLKGKVEVRG
jgi:hypothetical protein